MKAAAAVLLTTALFVAACTNAAVDKAVGAGPGSGIAVAKTGTSVTVTNNTGRPALDIMVSIDGEAPQPYYHQIPTLEPGQRVDVPLTDFHNEDGALLDTAAVTPRQIRLSGRDTLAQRYESTTPW